MPAVQIAQRHVLQGDAVRVAEIYQIGAGRGQRGVAVQRAVDQRNAFCEGVAAHGVVFAVRAAVLQQVAPVGGFTVPHQRTAVQIERDVAFQPQRRPGELNIKGTVFRRERNGTGRFAVGGEQRLPQQRVVVRGVRFVFGERHLRRLRPGGVRGQPRRQQAEREYGAQGAF